MTKNFFLKFSLIRYFCGACILLSFISCNAPTGIRRIWAIDDSEKIKQEDLENSLATDQNNKVWKEKTINIFGARNEIIAFQLIIQADSSGVSQVNVEISNLTNENSTIPGSAIGPADPFDYRGRNVELFTEHYLNITKRTPPLWFFSDSAAPPAYYTGWVPDCLIPFSAASGKGGAPFSVAGNKNQGVWVDILIPENALAGTYTGNATITIADKVFETIPIFLNVYDFTLSDSTHIKNMFGYSPGALAQRHGLSKGSDKYYDLEEKYQQMAHRHRFDLVTEVSNLDDMTRYYKRYYTGEIYTAAHAYAGPGKNTGNTTFSIGYGGDLPAEYGKSINSVTKLSWWTGSDAWENWFIQNAPGVERHKYLFPDEPDFKGPEGAKGTGSMDTIRMQAKWSHSNPGIGKNIPTLVTNTVKPGLKGYVDFWSISSEEFTLNITPEDIATERGQGHKFGIYNGFRPGIGAVVSDADAIEFRVMPWVVWKYKLDQYFYWSTTFWRNLNVFVNPLTYEDRINGDGTFLYPGQDNVFPEEDRNLAGPMSSIRAKNWRRGAQDFEYLWLAKKAGLEIESNKIVNECIPTGLWDAKSQTDVSWSSRGYKFEEYRKQLAELLSSHSSKNK
jgi:hypothetical protein